jgi:hypothetical protein
MLPFTLIIICTFSSLYTSPTIIEVHALDLSPTCNAREGRSRLTSPCPHFCPVSLASYPSCLAHVLPPLAVPQAGSSFKWLLRCVPTPQTMPNLETSFCVLKNENSEPISLLYTLRGWSTSSSRKHWLNVEVN